MVGLPAKANEEKPLLGILLMLAAYLFFSCIDSGSKWLALLGLSAMQLSFMRYIGHFVISAVLICKDGFSLKNFATEKPTLVIIRGLLLMLATILNFIAIRYIPLTLTATILFSAPIIVCALSLPLLGERVGMWRLSAILLGFIGILIAIRPFNDDFEWATLLSLAGAACFAVYSILTRKLSGVVAADTMQFYSGFVGTAILLPFAIAQWETPETTFQWSVMISLGVFGWLGHQLLTNAHGFAPANILMPFGYSFILYLMVWSFFLFDNVPDFWSLLGAAIIVTAGLIIWYREKLQSKILGAA